MKQLTAYRLDVIMISHWAHIAWCAHNKQVQCSIFRWNP